MVTYTTATKVGEFLQTTITSGTTPSTSIVEDWILQAEAEVDIIAGHSFTQTSASNVWITMDVADYTVWLPEPYKPLISVTTVQRNDGDDWTESLTSLTEGTDFLILDLDTAKLKFKAAVPAKSKKSLKIGTLTYGYATVPKQVEDLTTQLTAQKFLNSKFGNTSITTTKRINVGPIGIANDVNSSVSFIKNLNDSITELKGIVKQLKSYSY